MALTIRYFFGSFSSILPWSYCRQEWSETCIDSTIISKSIELNTTSIKSSLPLNGSSSAELYFIKEILKEKDTIHDGIGYPNWELVLCLALSWFLVALILIKGLFTYYLCYTKNN